MSFEKLVQMQFMAAHIILALVNILVTVCLCACECLFSHRPNATVYCVQ